MKSAIVMLADFSIATKYDGAPEQGKYGGEWGWASHSAHVQVPDGMDAECVKAQMSQEKWIKEGESDVTEDPQDLSWTHMPSVMELVEDQDLLDAKVQRGRDAKLALMRSQREEKLKEMDFMINDLTLALRADTAAVAQYKADLQAVTDSHKDGQDPNKGLSSLDALAEDLSDLTWPTKP